uniref:Large ribosomal subunit protein uL3c n=1 Tax=Spyridia filamentosa TaxID=196632 RepID=A0A1Z1MJL5_SPYFI|nr:ribosomal protein L3 [Spyridia filamentosa]ARW66248.1 ribosomal protein L3 [Spyridia filamentosa]
MSINLLGKKIGMTQVFNEEGHAIPVTILEVGPCIITQIKTIDHDGYDAIQIGYEYLKETQGTKAKIGHLKKNNIPNVKYLKEQRYKIGEKNLKIGQIVTVEEFKIGHKINVSGKSIGKGFCGYQKRHNFSRGPMSHGSKNHRQPGSIGAGTTPGRVFPGKRMAGHMGNIQTTIKNLDIIDVDPENNILIIKGAVPGKVGNVIYIYNNQ